MGERVFVNRLVVLDEQGHQVSQGSIDSYFVMDDSSSDTASSSKVINLPVPGLKPGYTLECLISREDLISAKSMPFEQASLSSNIPVKVSAFYVAGDVDAIRWAAPSGVKLERAGNALYCVEANPMLLSIEPNQPELVSFAPAVWVGPADASWEAIGREYLSTVEDRLALDDHTRAVAASVTQGCATKRDKLAAIAAHVQHAYTYKAIEFGRRARIPNTAATTLDL
jgi:hypothetical protein